MAEVIAMIHPNYKKPKIDNGDLKTHVRFFEYRANDGPEPDEVEKALLYECLALAYNPSMKDREILNVGGTREGVTLKLRDPKVSYLPTNKHKVEINDYRYVGKVWEIVDIEHDFEDNHFIKIVLGVSE